MIREYGALYDDLLTAAGAPDPQRTEVRN
jgi:hypothetical protein